MMTSTQFTALLMVLLIPTAFIVTWTWLFVRRFLHGIPILPPVPDAPPARWPGWFVAAIFAGMIFLPPLLSMGFLYTQKPEVATEYLHPGVADAPTDTGISQPKPERRAIHPLHEFLVQSPTPWRYVYTLLFAALLVPLTEEFVFRVVIQGWLDARERELLHKRPGTGWRAVLLTALFFCMLHFRVGREAYPSEDALRYQFVVLGIAYLLIVGLGIVLLRWVFRCPWREFGFDLSHWKTDLLIGLIAFGAVALPTYLLQGFLGHWLGGRFAPDPIALFPVALTFGILYWRTRRLLPSLTVHCLLNGLSILAVFFAQGLSDSSFIFRF